MNRNGWMIAGLVALLVGVPLVLCGGLALAGFGGFLWAANDFGDRDAALPQKDIEAYLGAAFPASARNVNSHQEGFQDGFFLARVEMDPADATAFVAKTKFSGPAQTTNNPFAPRSPSMPAWWDAEHAKAYEWYERSVPGATETLLVDRSSSTVTIVSWQRVEF